MTNSPTWSGLLPAFNLTYSFPPTIVHSNYDKFICALSASPAGHTFSQDSAIPAPSFLPAVLSSNTTSSERPFCNCPTWNTLLPFIIIFFVSILPNNIFRHILNQTSTKGNQEQRIEITYFYRKQSRIICLMSIILSMCQIHTYPCFSQFYLFFGPGFLTYPFIPFHGIYIFKASINIKIKFRYLKKTMIKEMIFREKLTFLCNPRYFLQGK